MADISSPSPKVDLAKRGLLAPLRRDQKNDFAHGTAAELQASNIRQALMTQAATDEAPGEVAWDGTLGSSLHLVLHRNGTVNMDDVATYYVVDAIRQAEPRARVTSVQLKRDKSTLMLVVKFVPTDGNGRAIADEQNTEIPVSET